MRDLVVITNDEGSSAICCLDSWNQDLPKQALIWQKDEFVFVEDESGTVLGKCDESCFTPLLNSTQTFFATLRQDGLETDGLVKITAKQT